MKNCIENNYGALEIMPEKGETPGACKQREILPIEPKENLETNMIAAKPTQIVMHLVNPSKLNDPNTCIAELNKRFAVAKAGNKVVIIDEQSEPLSFLPPKEFETLYSNVIISIGTKKIALGKFWLNHPDRRQYLNGIVFDPSDNSPRENYNLWNGFAVSPDPTKKCDLFLGHLENVICAGDDNCFQYFLYWLGHLIQHPNKLPGVAICLRSKQGAGKGILMEYIGRIFGRHYTHLMDKSKLLGRFTGHLDKAVFVFADEIHWSNSQSDTGILKGLVTEPTRIMERKNHDAIQVNNYVHLIMASNEKLVVPTEMSDRRFFILEVPDTKKGDNAYFDAIGNEMDNGGPEALLAYLQAIDLTKFKPSDFPKTAARIEQQLQSLDPIDAWIYELLQQGTINIYNFDQDTWPTEIEKKPFYQLYCDWLSRHRRGANPESIRAMTKKLGNIGIKTKKLSVNGQRPQGYSLPPLEILRKNFETLLDHFIEWESV